jgi:E3 ubiquitin-protein ligase TRIP12
MPRKGKAAASSGSGTPSGARSANTSLRAKAAANAAVAAANASSNSGRAAHANSQGAGTSSTSTTEPASSSRRQRDNELDEEALQGILDAHEEMRMQEDTHMDEGEYDEDDEDEDEEEDEDDDDSMHLIGGTMDLHHEDGGDASHLAGFSASGVYGDEDDDEDDIDEDDEIHGGEGDMLDEDFEAPLTFDADGNPIGAGAAFLQSNAAAAAAGGDRPSESGGGAPSSSDSDAWGGGGPSSAAAHARAALAAAAAAGDDDFGSFAASLRGYPSGFMGNMSSRLRGLLQNIRSQDLSVRMIALQELSELLSMSTEETLAGYFSVDQFVKELVKCLKGSAHAAAMNLEGMDEDDEYAMAQAIAAAADAAGPGGEEGSEDEMQLLACRCLANLIEAMPHSAGNIVSNGAVPVLCEKLLNITVIDLAEQTISVSARV